MNRTKYYVIIILLKSISGDNMTKIKICGITCREDVEILNEFLPEYAGFVMFFPKSRRNISTQTAYSLLPLLDKRIKTVAVTVCPTAEQVSEIGKCGFDFIQMHGEVESSVIDSSPIPVFKAFNVSDIDKVKAYAENKNVCGYVFDAASPGSGKTFDWDILKNIPHDNKLFLLAGGLDCSNVLDAIKIINPDIVDVSSGVENETKTGKSREKVAGFITAVRKSI